jgi:hypothetical protein
LINYRDQMQGVVPKASSKPAVKSPKKKVISDNSDDEFDQEEFIDLPKKRRTSTPKKIEKPTKTTKITYIKELREQILKRLSMAELEKLKHLDLLARVAIESQPQEIFEENKEMNHGIHNLNTLTSLKVTVL